jgi:alpha-D-ribose 1-methylphosphonate 5-phosphate C-P lyase
MASDGFEIIETAVEETVLTWLALTDYEVGTVRAYEARTYDGSLLTSYALPVVVDWQT